jgi:hypothetical protein
MMITVLFFQFFHMFVVLHVRIATATKGQWHRGNYPVTKWKYE